MKRNNTSFYEFVKKGCEYKNLLPTSMNANLRMYTEYCYKTKTKPILCCLQNCYFISNENKNLLLPASELLRILDIEFIHLQKNSSGKKDTLKSNKNHADLFIMLDNILLLCELKVKGKNPNKNQEEKIKKYSNINYAKSFVIDDLNNMFDLIMKNLSKREKSICCMKLKELSSWCSKHSILKNIYLSGDYYGVK